MKPLLLSRSGINTAVQLPDFATMRAGENTASTHEQRSALGVTPGGEPRKLSGSYTSACGGGFFICEGTVGLSSRRARARIHLSSVDTTTTTSEPDANPGLLMVAGRQIKLGHASS
jgi:hypothetical protein